MATIFQKPEGSDSGQPYKPNKVTGRKKLASRQVSKKPDPKSSGPSVKKSVNIWNKLESLGSFKGFFHIRFKGFWKKSGKEEKIGSKEHSVITLKKASTTLKKMAETVENAFVQLPSRIDKAMGSPFKKRAEAHSLKEKVQLVSTESQVKVKSLYAEHKHAKAADLLLKIAKHDPQLAGRLLQESNIPRSDRDLAINGLVNKISDPKMFAEIMIGVANREIEDETNPANLLKGFTPSGKLMESFISKFLSPKLCKTPELMDLLKTLPHEALRTPVSGGYTISKEQQQKAESFIEKSLTLTTKLLSEHKDDQWIQAFLHICQEIGKKGNEKFGDSPDGYPMGTLTAGNLLLIRFLNTAILTPLAFEINIPPRTDKEADNAVLISKVLQTIANRTQTKNEEYMSVFNGFIDNTGIPLADGIRTTLTQP